MIKWEEKYQMFEYPIYKKILFCTDFSESSERTFAYACAIAERDKGKIYLMHVIPATLNKEFLEGLVVSDISNAIHKNLNDKLEEDFRKQFINRCHKDIAFETVIREGREYQEIIKFAIEEKVDLIVLGTHGLTGIGHVLMGSVADKVVRNSPVPVFTIPSMEKHEAKGKF
jgi:nucleotide-binding universal stress UspA family protein